MQKFISYATGALALLIVTAAIIGALIYAVTHGLATLNSLATSCLQGIGMAVGGMVGSMLVLRWKSARRYIGRTVHDIASKSHHPDDTPEA